MFFEIKDEEARRKLRIVLHLYVSMTLRECLSDLEGDGLDYILKSTGHSSGIPCMVALVTEDTDSCELFEKLILPDGSSFDLSKLTPEEFKEQKQKLKTFLEDTKEAYDEHSKS